MLSEAKHLYNVHKGELGFFAMLRMTMNRSPPDRILSIKPTKIQKHFLIVATFDLISVQFLQFYGEKNKKQH